MKTNRIVQFGMFILLAITMMSCDEWLNDRIEGNNHVISKTRDISTFNEVVSTGNFEVEIIIADSISLIVRAEENLFPFILTTVRGQKFYAEVKDDYQLDNNQPIKIFLTTPNLEGVILTGSGIIVCDSLTTDFISTEITGSGRIEFSKVIAKDVIADISGSGDIIISGETDRSEFYIPGSGNIQCLDLYQTDCYSNISGSGNIYTNVNDYLEVDISGSGSVFYSGSPEIDSHISGSGQVIRYSYNLH
jgi:Putative auto-transporter adhesin, head GIN domain